MPGQGRPARDETGWRAGDAGCRGGDVGHRPLDAAPPTGGARPRGAGQQPAAAGVLAALARVAVGSVERLSGAVRLKQMIFLHNTCILVGLGLEYAVPYLCNPLDPPMPRTFRSQAVRLYRLHQARPSSFELKSDDFFRYSIRLGLVIWYPLGNLARVCYPCICFVAL